MIIIMGYVANIGRVEYEKQWKSSNAERWALWNIDS